MSMSLAVGRKKRLISVISGMPIFAISGSEETDEERRAREERERQNSNNGGGSETGSGSGGGGSGEGGSNNTGTQSNDKHDVQDNRDAQDVETYRRRAEAADKSKGEIEKKYNELLDKEKSDLERANSKIEEQGQTIAKLTQQRDNAIIQGELLKFPGYQWHDSDALLSLIDKSAIQIDDEGKVTGVKDAITKIAKEKPYLLKSQPGDAPNNDQNKNKQQTGGQQIASGSNGSNGNGSDDKSEQRGKLTKKYHLPV